MTALVPDHGEDWQPVWEKSVTSFVERLAVPGGWIYRTWLGSDPTSTCFVPEPPSSISSGPLTVDQRFAESEQRGATQ